MVSQTLTPERYVLDRTQLAAALSLGGLPVGPTSPLPKLPVPVDPGAVLQGTDLVNARGGLTVPVQAALAIAAAPQRLLTVRVNRAGQQAWAETNYFQGAGEAVAAVAAGEHRWDVALLPTTLHAAAMVNDHLQLTALPSLPGGKVIDFDLPGYAAVLAMTDAVQTARLGARLAREQRPMPLLTAEVLEGMLQKGLDATDTRWAVTASRLTSPTNLRPLLGQMAAGLRGLIAAELVETGLAGAALTASGAALAGALGELISCGAVVMAASSGSDQVTVAHTGVFRCTTAIWLATWSAWGAGQGRVQLRQVSGPTAVRFVHGLLAPGEADPLQPSRSAPAGGLGMAAPTPASPAPQRAFCPQCGNKLAPGHAFCGQCGHRLDPAPARAVDSR